jgi:hypothetical protein
MEYAVSRRSKESLPMYRGRLGRLLTGHMARARRTVDQPAGSRRAFTDSERLPAHSEVETARSPPATDLLNRAYALLSAFFA